jgi:hypothetical protein
MGKIKKNRLQPAGPGEEKELEKFMKNPKRRIVSRS